MGFITIKNIRSKTNIFKKNKKEFEEKYPDENNVPRPSHWSGWRLMPDEVEFWLDGEGRIHERLNYKKNNGKWERTLSLKGSIKTKVS